MTQPGFPARSAPGSPSFEDELLERHPVAGEDPRSPVDVVVVEVLPPLADPAVAHERTLESRSDESLLERLRALGYVQ